MFPGDQHKGEEGALYRSRKASSMRFDFRAKPIVEGSEQQRDSRLLSGKITLLFLPDNKPRDLLQLTRGKDPTGIVANHTCVADELVEFSTI